MPGCIMAMARLNRPSLMVYGGTIRAGCAKFRGEDKKLDIVNTLEAYGQLIAGKITEDERKTIVQNACPGAGACGGMYTANTMSSFIECMGLIAALLRVDPGGRPGARSKSASPPARRIRTLLEQDLKPKRHRHPAEFPQRDAADDRPRRLDQRRAPLDRDGPRVRHRPDDRRLAEDERRDAVPRRPQAVRAST